MAMTLAVLRVEIHTQRPAVTRAATQEKPLARSVRKAEIMLCAVKRRNTSIEPEEIMYKHYYLLDERPGSI